VEKLDFEQLVNDYYQPLYRFALSLIEREAEACDLTQQTFYLWASKGGQLRDRTKVKAWLFTTLHREFLGMRRRATRFPQHELGSVEHELPPVTATTVNEADASTVLQALMAVDEVYRAPLMLFYLEEHSYLEIAAILDVPVGTVMSRLARGKAQLRGLIADEAAVQDKKIVPLNLAKAG
jgi:RNA polymerase sigma factor (sigma-70 family)